MKSTTDPLGWGLDLHLDFQLRALPEEDKLSYVPLTYLDISPEAR